MSRHRKPDTQLQITRLELRHIQLAARVAELDRQLFMSAHDQLLVSALKKEKLVTKDLLTGLRRS